MRALRPDDLLEIVIRNVVARVPGLDCREIDDIIVGCAVPQDEHGDNIARRVAVQLGYSSSGVTVNRFCASSVQTTRMAMHAIRAGEGRVFVSAGVDCASRYRPNLEPDRNPQFARALARSAARHESDEAWTDPVLEGELPDVYIDMGETAENVAGLRDISRQRQDEYAVLSQQRTEAARAAGFFDDEIVAIPLADGTVISDDESPRVGVTLERMAALEPVFRAGGTVTAGNACPLNDGAAALVVMSDEAAQALGVTPLARVIATSTSSLSPEIMGMGPVEAIRRVLASAAMSVSDVDLFEINEAFAAQVLPCLDDLNAPIDRVNVHGGAIAIGHPFGATGARLIGTLINGLKRQDATVGVVSMCVAGGQGMALVLERMS
jgi:acetyl-CoA C-acetyltransferase